MLDKHRGHGHPHGLGPASQDRFHVRKSDEFKISIASGSPTSLISATLVLPCAYNISSLGLPTSVTVEEPLTARIVSGAPSASAEPKRSKTTPTCTRRNQARPSSFSRRHIHSSTSSSRCR